MTARRDLATSRNKILDVAERLFAQNGYAATSIGTISTEAGVGSVYHHFGSKTGLLQAVVERARQRFFAAVPRETQTNSSPRERLVRHYRGAARAVLDNLSFFRIEVAMLLQDDNSADVQAFLSGMAAEGSDTAARLFQSIAADAGAPDPVQLGRHIADLTIIFTRGAACQLGNDSEQFEAAFDGLAELMWSSIVHSRHDDDAR